MICRKRSSASLAEESTHELQVNKGLTAHMVIGSACAGAATGAALACLTISASLSLNSRASWHAAHPLQHVYAQHAGQFSPSRLNCLRSFSRSQHPTKPCRHNRWLR